MTPARWSALVETLRLVERTLTRDTDGAHMVLRSMDPELNATHFRAKREALGQIREFTAEVENEALAEACRETLAGVARG